MPKPRKKPVSIKAAFAAPLPPSRRLADLTFRVFDENDGFRIELETFGRATYSDAVEAAFRLAADLIYVLRVAGLASVHGIAFPKISSRRRLDSTDGIHVLLPCRTNEAIRTYITTAINRSRRPSAR